MRILLVACAAAVAAATLVPAHAQTPLPERAAFLAAVKARLATNDELRTRFAYRERRTDVSFNPFGRMGTGPVEVYEVFPGPAPELTYRRLVERGGQPLSAREIAEQDRRHLAKIEAFRRERARESPAQRAARLEREREAQAQARRERDEALALFEYTIVGRERHEGHPAIVVTFAPAPGARPRTREQRVAAAFKGRAWVHEHEHEIMRIEATAVDDVSFGLGMIARLHEGARATFVRRPLGFDRWLPVESRFEGTGRALLVRRVTFHYVHEYFDYRPFDGDQLAALLARGQTPGS